MRRGFVSLLLLVFILICAPQLTGADTTAAVIDTPYVTEATAETETVSDSEIYTVKEQDGRSRIIRNKLAKLELPPTVPSQDTVSAVASAELSGDHDEQIETTSSKISDTTDDENEPYTETVAIPDSEPVSLGTFTVTAYCDCSICNGKWTGHKLNTPTQAGLRYPVEGYTISVDPDVIPLGSVVSLEGVGPRYAQDTGSAIKGNRIDLFFYSHDEALEFGVKKLEVWLYRDNET